MQSFLGSLNYYSRFIEDYAIYAAILYELREVDFAAMSKAEARAQIKAHLDQPTPDHIGSPSQDLRSGDLGSTIGETSQPSDLHPSGVASTPHGGEAPRSALELQAPGYPDLVIPDVEAHNPEIPYLSSHSLKTGDLGLGGLDEIDPRWIRAHRAFAKLKSKVASTPILRHFNSGLQPVVVVYANDWAISAALMQEHDGIHYPVTFVSRTLKSNELNYGIVEKEVLALLRILDLGYNMLVGRPIKVLTRYSTLAWLFRSPGLQGRLGQWAALLSPWTLEIVKCTKGEDEILGAIAASITPRSQVDQALIAIAPKKEPKRQIQVPIPTLPEWSVVKARSGYAEGLTVNEAEYHGLLLCMDLLEGEDRRRLVICGDSNLVIRQVRGEIDCKAPGLTLLRQKALDRLQIWPDHELVHVKRDWNGSADSLASAALQRQGGILVDDETDLQDLVTLNRLHEILVVRKEEADSVARVSPATTRSKARSRSTPTVLQEEVVRELRIDRIRQAQDEEAWIAGLKKYLVGAAQDLTQDEARSYGNISMDYEVDLSDLLFYCHPTRRSEADRDGLMRLVIPETLQQDVLHHYHASLEGGHQGIGRTYQKIRDHFHWRGLYRSVQQYVGECVDCETGKGRPRIQGESPGNIQATYPFQIIAMDHIPSLPKSYKGNTELLIWVDLFTGYVIAKASASRTAQTIAESYEECVFRRFGASEVIRRDHHHNEGVHPHQIEVGSRVWLYLDRVKEGYARKLAHLWHGPFRVAEKIGEYAARIELAGTEYRLFPVVHVSKLKLVKTFPDRPQIRLTVEDTDRLDFDEALLPEDSWIQGLDEDEYEVEKITDMRTGKRTRYGRIYREFLVHWRGYDEPTWTDETDLNCGAVLHDFLRDRANRNRFGVMQSHEE
ncbi:reverse transcriptase [Phytophthora cinnamomi]|uniref:reverse transcriptase n=1 Tax=Phytophthora cinnamomi TaxID=4785 RepID=UPI00355A147C|nr:reverse transcriptase [Phytophthora cinnamomi]